MINDILDMSKIEAGRMKLDMEPLDLSKTLAELLRVVSGRADDKNLVLDADIESTIPVVADRRAIKQIIVNLLSNAVKFTPDGGKVTVRSRLRGNSILLMIADTGIGIAPQSLQRLGRPFEQVESQLTKTYHGSGLGLAIARSLTGLHGGSMRLRSQLGTGTVVCVSLPRDGGAQERGSRLPRDSASPDFQRRRDLAGDLRQGGDQRRQRVALRHHQPDAVGDPRVDDGDAPHRVRQAERLRQFRRISWPSVRAHMGIDHGDRVRLRHSPPAPWISSARSMMRAGKIVPQAEMTLAGRSPRVVGNFPGPGRTSSR